MIQKKRMKKGLLVWWESDYERINNCPAIITKVELKKSRFKILPLNCSIETDWIPLSLFRRREIRMPKKGEVEEYLKRARQKAKDAIEQIKADIEEWKEHIKIINKVLEEI